MGWNKKLQNLTCLKVWFRQVQIAGPRFCAISQMPPLPAQSNIEHFVESMDWWTGNYQTAISKLASSARYSWSFDLALDPDHNLWSLIPRLDPDPEHFPFLLILEWRIYHIWQTQGVCTLGRVYDVRVLWEWGYCTVTKQIHDSWSRSLILILGPDETQGGVCVMGMRILCSDQTKWQSDADEACAMCSPPLCTLSRLN